MCVCVCVCVCGQYINFRAARHISVNINSSHDKQSVDYTERAIIIDACNKTD